MPTRVQVILGPAELEAFRRCARLEGVSLSAWLRQAGRQRLEAQRPLPISTKADLQSFFEACDAREQGREPDWDAHLTVIQRSRRSGETDT